MDCKGIEEKLSAYIDHQLSEEKKLSVDEHLLSCEKCRHELEELKKTITHINNLEEVEPPAWLEQKIMAGIREEAEGRKGFYQKLFSRLHINTPLQALATIAVLMTALFVFRAIEPEMKKARAPMEPEQPATIEKEEEKMIARQKAPGKRDNLYSFGELKLSKSSDIKQRQKAAVAVPSSPSKSPTRISPAGAAPAEKMQGQTRKSFAYKSSETEKNKTSGLTQRAVQFTLHGAAAASPERMLLTDKGLDERNLKEEIIPDTVSGISLVLDLMPVLETSKIIGSALYLVTVNITSHTLHMPESVSIAHRNELKTEAENLVRSLNEWKRELDGNEVSLLDKNNELTIAIEEPLRNLRYFKYNPLELTLYRTGIRD